MPTEIFADGRKLNRRIGDRAVLLKARMSTVDGLPYKEEVGGSNPSVPTRIKSGKLQLVVLSETAN